MDEVERLLSGFEFASGKDLKTLWADHHIDELVEALESTRWTGRPGYPIGVMWRTLIFYHANHIPSIQQLIRTLHDSPVVAVHCGIYSDAEVPTRFAYYRFMRKLIQHFDHIERCMARTLAAHEEHRPGLWKTIVIDSTDVATYANPYKKPNADPEATWGFKPKFGDENFHWLGYKVHLASAVAGEYEIPLIPIITPANRNDSPIMIPLLRKNAALIPDFSPKYVLGDKGYDGKENCRAIVEDLGAIPIIDMRLGHRKGKPDRFEDIANEKGTPYCARGIPMVFWGYDKKQKRLKYRCPVACGRSGCTWIEKCSKSSYGHVVKVKLKDDYRRFTQVPRETQRWQVLYNKRTSIERIFNICKKDGNGKLVNHKLMGLDKIRLNSLLSIWVIQAKSLKRIREESGESGAGDHPAKKTAHKLPGNASIGVGT